MGFVIPTPHRNKLPAESSETLFIWRNMNSLQRRSTTRGCGRSGAARYGAVLAVEYVRAVLGLSRSVQGGKGSYATCQISGWSDNRRRWSYGDFSPTTQLAAVTSTSDPLTLKLVHGVLVSQGPFLPRPFRFPSRWSHGTDRRTGSTHDRASS